MKVMITGGGGFIGSYITRQLLQDGHEVVIFDSFVNYISPLESFYQVYLEKRFEGIKGEIQIIRGDTRNKSEVYRAIRQCKPNRIIHLAALPIADLCNKHSEEALSSILNGTVNVLEAIRDVDRVDRFVYASSSMIYGDFQYHPADEEHPKNPKGVYGGTKLGGEILTEAFSRRFEIEYAIVRPSAVYGPTDVNRRVTQIFVENALKGKPLILHGGGHTQLDFTYVTDTACGFVLVTTKPEAANQIFNITRGEGRSLKDLADIIKSLIPGVTTVEQEADVFRPKRGALDISKAKKMLGYEPKYSLEEGMAKYVEFVRDTGVIKPLA